MQKSVLLKTTSFILVGCSLMMGGCARNISSGTYAESHVGEASQTFQGVVASVRQVTVEGSEHLQNNVLGGATGALAGGFGGSFLGKGRGNIAATGVGAIAGAVAGAYAEKELRKQQAFEYVVRLRSGEMRTVVQGLENPLAVGQPVLLMVSYSGRSRLVADHSGR